MNDPAFSIVIPTFNRPDRLLRCIATLDSLDYPRERFEVIVVDDGSPEPVQPLLHDLRVRFAIKCHSVKHGGPAAARNIGAAHAAGRFLAFLDDDCAPVPSWLARMEMHFRTDPSALVAGRVLNGLHANIYSEASQRLISYLMGYFNADSATARFVTANNMGVGREAFLRVGGFNARFRGAGGEDREFGDRWQQLGFKLAYCPDVEVVHYHHLTLRQFFRQHLHYGRGAATYHELRSDRRASHIRIEPFKFYRDLVLYPFTVRNSKRRLAIATLMILSQLANAAGFLYETLVEACQRLRNNANAQEPR